MALVVVGLTKAYTENIFIFGRNSFADVRPEYVEAVKIYAATGKINGVNNPISFTGYTIEQFDKALANGWITEEEYHSTLELKPKDDQPPTE